MDALTNLIIAALLALIFPALIVVIYFKRRSRRPANMPQDESVQGTSAELAAAEQALKALPIDVREHLVKTHELCERFSTRHGFSEEYIENLARHLRGKGVLCELVFQPGAPLGVADSILVQQGVYELFVEREQLETAKALIQEYKANS